MAISTVPLTGFPGSVDELRALFIRGRAPEPPLNGRYRGLVLRTTINAVADLITMGIGRVYMGWLGKRFDAATGRGDNHFRGGGVAPTRVMWPGYGGIIRNDDGTADAFAFRTWIGPGLGDPSVSVLKIDYDLPENPCSLRRVLDELVELPDGRLLGKAQLKTWWGDWTTVAYFALAPEVAPAHAAD